VSDVGVLFTFRVMPDPASDRETEEAMGGIFDAMASEEFPSGDVKAYAAFRDRADPGKWVMFEHFTAKGSVNHAKGPLMQQAGQRLSKLFMTPPARVLLDPVLFVGCGEPITGERSAPAAAARPAGRPATTASASAPSVSTRVLTLEAAARVVAAARRRAEAIGVPMNIAVVDDGNNLTAFSRMDGAWLGSISIAQNKAYTARAFDMDTEQLAPLAQPGQPLFGIHASNDGHLIIFAGGVPLREGGKVIGAIGVSGGSVEHDQDVALAGAAAL